MSSATIAKDHLKSFIERVERLEEEKKAIADDIRDVFAEAKGTGFNVKALKEILKIRKQDAESRAEHEAMVDLYMDALGMLADTPLGKASLDEHMKRAKKESKRHTSEWTKAHAEMSQAMADEGLLSQEQADDHRRTAEVVNARFGE